MRLDRAGSWHTKKPKSKNRPPVTHMRTLSSIIGVDGKRTDMPMCMGGWVMTDDWNAVTCKRCLRMQDGKG